MPWPRAKYHTLLWTLVLLLGSGLLGTAASARHSSDHPLSDEEWAMVMEKITLFDGVVFIPSLLPTIMQNRDALQLSDEQLARLYQWRKTHYVGMVNIMNELIEKKVTFSIEALSSEVDDAHLLQFQREIHQLQHELLKVRLSCRAILVETFTREQWENFEFIVADDPKLASLVSQARRLNRAHEH